MSELPASHRIRLVDAAGHRHRPAEGEVRLVSLVPSVTELLFDLGLGEQVVGKTTFCVHPREALEGLARVGGTKQVRLDRLRALAPTHVIVNIDENRREDVEAMAEFVPHIIVTHPLTPEDNHPLYHLLGGIFGRRPEAEGLSRALDAELEATRNAAESLPRLNVLYLIWRAPWMTVSRPTYISRMLSLVRWRTVANDPERRYPEVELGALAEAVDLVLLSSEPFPFKGKHIAEVEGALAGTPAKQALPAVRLIDGEYLSWYGSRAIAGVRYLRELALAERQGSTQPGAPTISRVGPRG